ncbi:hypothetical protein P344_01020 [Spiroplasma mirum ATCC 29335]|uniref:Uncharacterized protein n=1 Tax=Spiroplasma mirum ATCC 29335 TaxID=838561 RepID=W0GNK0_9MOLU|nr:MULTISPECIES: hypothetical protein [Spiroplasma]AHF60628.1 putative transmembrane protein [Spiroplasma mirum ATCC 29335]AHI57577.1 hypothetical protein P344_01020 [Spiroplasma mirum ATCC 29335]AKM52774.1 hypothetical protein SATRI_v1c02080 [Spiroplasma atrichopogonis]
MFGLENNMAGLGYFVFLIILGLLILGMIIIGLVDISYKSQKTKYYPKEILRKMLDDNDLKDVNIGIFKFIGKAQNFNYISNTIKIRIRDLNDPSVLKIYDMLFHFYYLFQIKTKKNRSFFWLKFVSYLLCFVFVIFITTTILIILCNVINNNNLDIDSITTAIQVLAIVGLILLIISWFSWTNIVEKYRKDLIDLADEYLDDQTAKKIKLLTAFKAFFPFSENVIFFT